MLVILSDLRRAGGAEMTIAQHVKYARKVLRLSPIWLTPAEVTPGLIDDGSLFILHSIRSFPPAFIGELVHKKPAIYFEHDFGFCRYRDHLCSLHCREECDNEFYEMLFSHVELSIFMSPTHCKMHLAKFEIPNAALCPAACDLSPFRPGLASPVHDVCFFGRVCVQKGTRNMRKWAESHPDRQLDCYGPIFPVDTQRLRLLPNVRLGGRVPHEEVPSLLRAYKAFLFLPESFEAFGRVVPEALCTGLRLIANDRIGALEWDDPVSAAEHGAEIFWDLVAEACHEELMRCRA